MNRAAAVEKLSRCQMKSQDKSGVKIRVKSLSNKVRINTALKSG